MGKAISFRRYALIGSAFIAFASAYAGRADGVEFRQKILNPDTATGTNRYFGQALDLSGPLAAISSAGNSGTVYLLERNIAGLWDIKGAVSGGQYGSDFGWALDMDGTSLLIGDRLDDSAAFNGGAAFLYSHGGGGWSQIGSYYHKSGSEQCGKSVALSGSTVALGAPFHNTTAGGFVGVAIAGTSGLSALNQIEAFDGAAGDWYGWSVGASGRDILIGAYMASPAGSDSGAVYSYRFDSSNVLQFTGKFTAGDAGPADEFGCSIAISGDVAIIGALGYDAPGGNNCGAAYVFHRDADGVWTEQQRLLPDVIPGSAHFGSAVAIDGDRIVVGAPMESDIEASMGAAYLFEKGADGLWTQTGRMTAFDADYNDRFGIAVGISGDTVMVGSHYDDYDGHSVAGSVYVFAVPEPASLSFLALSALLVRRRR